MAILRDRMSARGAAETAELAALIAERTAALDEPGDLSPLVDSIGDARYVLLGEASHGTHEYYTWRSHLSKWLIRQKGFSFIAVEGDWPDCYRVNRYVKGYAESGDRAFDVLHAFDRWPTWMWANWEIVALTEWLRVHNADLPAERRVGFYGLDVYSLWDSLHAVLGYARQAGPDAVVAAQRAFACFQPYGEDATRYARAVSFVPDTCRDEVIAMLATLRHAAPQFDGDGRESFFNAEQNAVVVKNAEAYYRTMIDGGPASWNIRDRHMVETLDRLMRHHGPEAKAIVWEHNTHIGDARATDMAAEGMVNVGQLVREAHEDEGVVLVGFGSYGGTVIAGVEWDAPMERMTVPSGREGSWENVFHRASATNHCLLMRPGDEPEIMAEPRPHRAIGVVYRPEHERFGNYVPTILPDRYDAFLYFDHTQALHPLHIEPRADGEPPETYPWNV